MKFVSLLPAQICYRVNTPRWARQPTSGAGAAKVGGRFNRKGTPALYLALDQITALREYQQDEPIMPPGTLAAYHVVLDQVADFRDGYVAGEWEPLWEDWNCTWRNLHLLHGITPPSWDIGDGLLEQRIPGLLFPSTRHVGGVNLVVFTDPLDASGQRQVTVHDPQGRLKE